MIWMLLGIGSGCIGLVLGRCCKVPAVIGATVVVVISVVSFGIMQGWFVTQIVGSAFFSAALLQMAYLVGLVLKR